LQWLGLDSLATAAPLLPAYGNANNGVWLQKDFSVEELRRQVGAAVRRKRKLIRTPERFPLDRLLFFLEKLRAFLPKLLQQSEAGPLLDYLQPGIAELLPCQVAGSLIVSEACPKIQIEIIRPVQGALLPQVASELLAGYRLFKGDDGAAPAVVVKNDKQIEADGSACGLGSFCAMPLVSAQQFHGILAFASAQSAAFSRPETAYLCHLANHLSRIFPDLSRLQNLAVRDELTGLNNRRSFEIELQRSWQLNQRYHTPVGLLLMDLDKFKALNDNYGHMIGDAVLKEFAQILEGIARRTDVLARYGGDEFAVILNNSDAEHAGGFAKRLLEAVSGHVFCKDRYPLQMSVSIGVAGSDQAGVKRESDLVALADRACYSAKDSGQGGIGKGAEVIRETPAASAATGAPVAEATPAGQVRIMIIDDEAVIGSLFERILTPLGFSVLIETSPLRALERIKGMTDELDVAVVDFKMPEMNGVDVIRELKNIAPETVCIVLTGFASVDITISAIRAGAYDFVQKPVNFNEFTFILKRGVEHRQLRRQVATYQHRMENLLNERTRSLDDAIQALERSSLATLTALSSTLEMHETDVQSHDRRVAEYAVFMARRLRLDENHILEIKRAALLHDIGKIGIPDAILQKPAPLNEVEKKIMEQHPAIGWQIVKNVPFLQDEAEMIYQHHEHYDGTGYPRRLGGKAIILGARLFAVVDAFDALRSNRVYREALPLEQAVAEIRKGSGTQFDPEIVELFLACYKEMDRLSSNANTEN
jgi:diguanylate cyclase (GGDEF)-like protein/putative nucleotidyltransferase with HDIG domain